MDIYIVAALALIGMPVFAFGLYGCELILGNALSQTISNLFKAGQYRQARIVLAIYEFITVKKVKSCR